jgi:hypothetical protein
MGNNGKKSYGVAQMEAATAKLLGIDPERPTEAVKGVAILLREASDAFELRYAKGLRITDEQGRPLAKDQARLAYLSIHYNTSTAFRNGWTGSLKDLPFATTVHIHNMRDGLLEANRVQAEIKGHAPLDLVLRERGTPEMAEHDEPVDRPA